MVARNKKEKNEQSEQSKSGTKKCALEEATVSAVTICGGSLFQTSRTRIAKNSERIFTLESGQYSLRECPLVQPPDSVKNSLCVIVI